MRVDIKWDLKRREKNMFPVMKYRDWRLWEHFICMRNQRGWELEV